MLPEIAPEAVPFWDATRDRRLLLQHCERCGHQWYPRSICAGCGDPDPGWVESAGTGTLHSFTVVHRAPEGFDPPYVIGIVELDEGPRMLARIEGPDPTCDAPVTLDWQPLEDGRHLPIFRTED
jgi:uncharacterized OB-fold protein